MKQRQVNVRLDEDIIDRLKNISKDNNTSFSSLVNELLSNELKCARSNSIGITKICIKFDNLLSTLRNIDRKISISKGKGNEPN
jgi:predicted DNA-binding ribbon-helix-helix protein